MSLSTPTPAATVTGRSPDDRHRHRHGRDPAPRGRRWRDVAWVAGGWTVGAAVFFYAQWTSGFDRVMGNAGDSRLIVYLNEHWYHVLRGGQAWLDPAFYYPTQGVLGYSDTFFLWQVFYVPLRLLGAEPFLAFQLTIVAMSLLGFVTFVAFVRAAFGTPVPLGVAGAMTFVFASNLAAHAGSPQVFGIYFVPPIALLGLHAWRSRAVRPRSSVALGFATGLLAALLLFSTYYVGWFTLLGAALVAVLALVVAPRRAIGDLAGAFRTGWRSLGAGCIGFGLGLIPFLETFLPVIHELGVRRYGDALYFAPRWRDLASVGSGNIVWGGLMGHLQPGFSTATYETTYAVTPVLRLLVMAGGCALAWALVTGRAPVTGPRRFVLALCITQVLVTVLPVDTWAGSPWVVVWHLPGATAIRAVDRIQVLGDLVAALALCGLVTDALAHWPRLRRSPVLKILLVLLLVAAVAEQATSDDTTQLDRRTQLAELGRVPRPPVGCTSFFVVDPHPGTRSYVELQTDAMLLSQRFGVPTLDGYSGDAPPGWDLDPTLPDAVASALDWAHQGGLRSGVCQLDLATSTWDTHPTAT